MKPGPGVTFLQHCSKQTAGESSATLLQQLAALSRQSTDDLAVSEPVSLAAAFDRCLSNIQLGEDWQESLHNNTQEGGLVNPLPPLEPDQQRWRKKAQDLACRPGFSQAILALLEQESATENPPLELLRYGADRLAHAGRLESAIEVLQAALGLEPQSGRLLARQAECRYREGDSAAAEALWRQALDHFPHQYQALGGLGLMAYYRQDAATALDCFKTLAQVAPAELGGAILLRMAERLDSEQEAQSCIAPDSPVVTIAGLSVAHLQSTRLVPLTPGIHRNKIGGGISAAKAPEFVHHLCSFPAFGIVARSDFKDIESRNSAQQKRSGSYFFGGVLFRHFGHFMAESIHRLWAWQHYANRSDKILFLAEQHHQSEDQTTSLLPYEAEALSYLGIDLQRVEVVTECTEVETLVVAEQASLIGTPPHLISPRYIEFLSLCDQRYLRDHPPNMPAKYPQRLLVSRSHLLLNGAIAGEAYLEQQLIMADFQLFRPEQHALMEQLNHYRHAKVVIFSEGSALHALELLGDMSAYGQFIVLCRRPVFRAKWETVLRSRWANFLNFSATLTLPSVNLGKQRHLGQALALISDADYLLSWLFQHTGITLPAFDTETFYQQEADDVLKYLQHYANGNSPEFESRLAEFLERWLSLRLS